MKERKRKKRKIKDKLCTYNPALQTVPYFLPSNARPVFRPDAESTKIHHL